MTVKLHEIYAARIASGALVLDPAQDQALAALQNLCDRLTAPQAARKWWQSRSAPQVSVRGIYLHGAVGRGKSMLMDLFFEHAPIPEKRRVHFHQFMLEIHATLHRWRQEADHAADPLPQIAQGIVRKNRLLCFDEFHVSDIADAMILGRLFTSLFEAGVTLVATSNIAPTMLYHGGLQRQLFLPFIEVLKAHVDIVAMQGGVDHRLARLVGQEVFFTPLSRQATAALAGIFSGLTGDAEPVPETIDVQGRPLTISRAAKGVAWCDFGDLCSQALGAGDYLALSQHFHTLVLDGVPRLEATQRNEALRFMTLIDALYEAKVKLIMASAVPPEQLYQQGQHAQTFQRTVSRLNEMRAADYMALPHRE